MFIFPNLFKLSERNNAIDKPPTLYALLNSIANFEQQNQVKVYDLPEHSRDKIFDFNYPLSEKVDKAEFEKMILSKFMMRRIGFETLTAFKLQLYVKLNEIMPRYNKLFDALNGWDLFNDGEKITRLTQSTSQTTATSTSNSQATSDNRNSQLPQSEISNVQNASYLTDYTYAVNNGSDNSNSTGNSTSNGNETVEHTQSDKIKVYNDFIENKNNIYTMIFKDLDSLFYQLI